MSILTFKVWDGNSNLVDADTAPVLSDKTGVYGIKRNDTDATVVNADTALVKSVVGTYVYDFVPPATLIQYTAWIKVIYNRKTSYYEIIFTPPAESLTFSTPADILWQYLIDIAALFTDPDDDDPWPLYNDYLPDSGYVADDVAVIFTTSGILHGKDEDGTQYQHYGLQLRARSSDKRDAYEKLKNVMSSLLIINNQEILIPGGDTYVLYSISQTTDIVPIHIDHKKRTHYTVNFIVAYSQQ